MSADTEENWQDYKNYEEKLAIVEDQSYPLAIGGAGIADLIEPMTQEVIEQARTHKPATSTELERLIRSAIETVYRDDLPWLAVKKQHRSPEFLIAAKPPSDDFCILRIKGRRVYPVRKRAIIGYGTPVNNVLMGRMYRDNLPIQQAVMLAIYLVSLSKKLDEGVGGDTSIVIVRDNGAWIDDAEYVKQFEVGFIAEFLKLMDPLFLDCLDTSIPPSSVFPAKLKQFGEKVSALRYSALVYSAAHSLNRTFHDPTFRGEPYPKVFPGAVTTVAGDGTISVSEEPTEEREERVKMMRWAEEMADQNRQANADFQRFIQGRQPVYLAPIRVTLQPNGNANTTSIYLPSSDVGKNTSALPAATTEDRKGQQ